MKNHITAFIADSPVKVTRQHLEKELSRKHQVSKKVIRTAVRELVEANELTYTNIYGCTFLELSFNKPVRISRYVVLKPPDMAHSRKPKDIVVSLQSGISFGSGAHPTTRLAVRGMEWVLLEKQYLKHKNHTRALDIGTGSGVLAIAAVMMGMTTATGTDIDACAIAEARENVKLNQLGNQISICHDDISEMSGVFDLILANLRFPTLKQFYPYMKTIINDGGVMVISGIKSYEISNLLDAYKCDFECRWEKIEKDWAGLVLFR